MQTISRTFPANRRANLRAQKPPAQLPPKGKALGRAPPNWEETPADIRAAPDTVPILRVFPGNAYFFSSLPPYIYRRKKLPQIALFGSPKTTPHSCPCHRRFVP
jgi:hypothetical protein